MNYKLPLAAGLLFCLLAFCSTGYSQKNGYQIIVHIPAMKDTPCYLANYYGDKQYIQDTVRSDASGTVVFEGREQLPGGIYLFVFPYKRYFEMLVDKEQYFSMETTWEDPINNMKVKGSKDNDLFYQYLKFAVQLQKTSMETQEKLKMATTKADTAAVNEQLKANDEKMAIYRNQFMKDQDLYIPPGTAGVFRLEKNALHIWPRESFMMIALPNPDGSFTCTLFFPFEGVTSFSQLKTDAEVGMFFESTFPDAVALMPTLLEDYNANPTSSLVTVRCYPWVKNKTMLIGDAAHAIVPFFGQGMNAGFEDCRLLNQMLDVYRDDWLKVLPEFERTRKKDTDAIAHLALDNFIEMRDLVADADFLLRKKIEARLHQLYPTRWIPLYSMVTFYDSIPYSTAYETGQKQTKTWMR